VNTKKRIEWTGDTSTVAFVFTFIGEENAEDIEFPAYQAYEQTHPGALDELWMHYSDNEEAWNSNEVELNDEQIEQLQVYVACVNDWYENELKFFMAMNSRWHINNQIKEWDPADKLGLEEFSKADNWWRLKDNAITVLTDVQDRIENTLGEDCYLLKKFSDLTYDEVLEIYFSIFIQSAPYNYEFMNFTNDEGDIDIPEDELEAMNKFFASNVLLIDFKDASFRYRLEHPKL
jgi:hypothetical protein